MSDVVEGYLQSIDRGISAGPAWHDQQPWTDHDVDMTNEFAARYDHIRNVMKTYRMIRGWPECGETVVSCEMLLRHIAANIKAKFKSWDPSERARRLAH